MAVWRPDGQSRLTHPAAVGQNTSGTQTVAPAYVTESRLIAGAVVYPDAPPVRGSFGNTAGAALNSTVTATLPSGIQDGDTGYLIISVNNATSTIDPADPAGWTLVDGPITNAASNLRAWLYRRTMTASDSGATVTAALLSSSARWTISGVVVAGAGAADSVTNWVDNTDDLALSIPAVTPASDSDLLLTLAAIRYNTTTGGVTPGSSWTEQQDVTTTNGTAPVFGSWAGTRALSGGAGVTVPAEDQTYAGVARNVGWVVALPPGVPAQAASASGSITLGGAATAEAPASVTAGGITLGGSATAQAPATATGGITLGGTVTAAGRATATGSITLGGTATAAATATAAGSVTLGGTVTARAAATAAGTISLGGTSTAQAPATAAGSVTLSGAPTAQAPASSTGGSVTLSGAATARGAATASGSITLGGTATGVGPGVGSAAGSITLGGTATARAAATATGSVTLGGTVTGRAAATTLGTIVLGGAVTAQVPATAAGAIDLNGIANGQAAGALRDITLTVGPGRSRTLTVTPGGARSLTATGRSRALTTTGARSRELVAVGRSRTLTVEPLE